MKLSHWLYFFFIFTLSVFEYSLKLPAWKNVWSHWLHLFDISTVCFQMSKQSAFIRGCIITLIAPVQLFSTMRFQMFPQMACLKECGHTNYTFWLFSTVCSQMNPKITYQRGYIFTMVTFVWLFYRGDLLRSVPCVTVWHQNIISWIPCARENSIKVYFLYVPRIIKNIRGHLPDLLRNNEKFWHFLVCHTVTLAF